VRTWLARLRPWLTLAAAGLALGVLLPPVGSYARQYAFVETLQYVIFAVAAPGLLVLGAPWRLPELSRRDAPPGLPSRLAPSRWPGLSRPGTVLVAFIAAVIAWRLPAAVNALPGAPALTVAELVTLFAAGAAVWLELVDSPPLMPRLSRPQRAAMAATAMWTLWVLAYITGMSHGAWFSAYDHAAGHGLSTAADQQLAAGIMWAVPALCFAPVIYGMLIPWIGDSENPDDELREASRHERARAGLGGPLRPPRGWRRP